ncbi:YheC/YheD family protein [Alteribacter populi]|uniref:YheC/YheD family protein n=1 Tax=Alteribacter populi TaxID=2011011 RepID=UPI001FE122AE|nr:YheC/YheD family protein [Alteribacter populi]
MDDRWNRLPVAYNGYYNTSMYDYSIETEKLFAKQFSSKKSKMLLQMVKESGIGTAKILDGPLGTVAECSVDFGMDYNGMLWLIEVNGFPQKALYDDFPQKERERIFKNPILYSYYIANKKVDS